MYQIIKRKDAVRQGLFRYFTNKRCRKNHLSQRYTKNGNCVACSSSDAVKERRDVRQALSKMDAPRKRVWYIIDARDLAILDEFVSALKHSRELNDQIMNGI